MAVVDLDVGRWAACYSSAETHLHQGVSTRMPKGITTLTCMLLGGCWVLACSASELAGDNDAAVTEIAVLATLHGLHEEVPAYDFEALRQSLRSLEPDVICMEIDAGDLESRSGWGSKIEYPEVIMPLLDKHAWATCTMEPAPEVASPLIERYRGVSARLREEDPPAFERFGQYNEGMYEGLKAYWTSPARVNDGLTDRILGAKHALQIALFGPGEGEVWTAWNGHFLEQVVAAARRYPGKRIVVLAGVEHGYWLRAELERLREFRLLDTATLLSTRGDEAL